MSDKSVNVARGFGMQLVCSTILVATITFVYMGVIYAARLISHTLAAGIQLLFPSIMLLYADIMISVILDRDTVVVPISD